MKLLTGFAAVFLSLLLPQQFLQHGQYRGPEFDALFPGGSSERPPNHAGSNPDAVISEGFDRWEFWFEINKDILLRAKKTERALVLDSKSTSSVGADRVNPEIVDKEIFPILKEATTSRDPNVSRSAIVALGKIGTKEAYEVLENLWNKGDAEAQKLSALALGGIDDRKALTLLVKILESNAHPDLRAFAMMGIGVRGSAETVPIVKSFLERNLNLANAGGEMKNLVVAAITAIGMSRDASAVTLLTQKYHSLDSEGHSRARNVLIAMLTALGRIGDAAGLGTLNEAITAPDIEIRRAAALALGDMGNPAAVESLAKALNDDNDVQTKAFSAISLGKLGSQKAREALRAGFESKKFRTVRAFSAIGLGLAEDDVSAEALRKLFTSSEDESQRGAAAIALGFMRDRASIPVLLEAVEQRSTPTKLRGYAAIALGLIRPDGVLPKMITVLRQDPDRQEDFLRGLLLGIGLFRDPVSSSELVKFIAEDKRDTTRGYAALALGMTRDKSAIKPLNEFFGDKVKAQQGAAIAASIALGALGDRYNYPLISETFYSANYRVRFEILDRLMELF